MEIKIRKVQESDLTKVNEYALKLSEMHIKELPNSMNHEIVQFTKEEFKEICTNKNKNYMTVAVTKDNKIIGVHYVQFLVTKCDGKISSSKIGYFYMVYVDEEYRGTEVSTMLYQDARNYCIEKKQKGEIERIEFRVWGFNHNCLKFTEKQGIRHLYSVYEIL